MSEAIIVISVAICLLIYGAEREERIKIQAELNCLRGLLEEMKKQHY